MVFCVTCELRRSCSFSASLDIVLPGVLVLGDACVRRVLNFRSEMLSIGGILIQLDEVIENWNIAMKINTFGN